MRTAHLSRMTEQQAWRTYADRLRGLQGEEYDQAETEAWDELQAALRLPGGEAATDDDRVG